MSTYPVTLVLKRLYTTLTSFRTFLPFITSETRKSCCPQQVVFRKPVDYSKVAVYKCKVAVYSKAAVYKCKVVVYSKVAVYKCKVVVYKCKVVVYTCKPAVYSCKVLNFRFTTVILITLLDTVEVTPFFQFFA